MSSFIMPDLPSSKVLLRFDERCWLVRDKLGSESLLEFQRSWYVKGHIRCGVISSVLAQRHLRYSQTKARGRRTMLRRSQAKPDLYYCRDHFYQAQAAHPMEEEFQGIATRDVGTESHGGPTEPVLQTQKTHSPSSAFIKENINVLRTMIKEHDQQAKMKATPRKLAYADSDKEAPIGSLAKGFSDRFSLESSGTSDTHRQTRSTIKSQKTPSKNKELTRLTRSRRLEYQSTTKEKARREKVQAQEKETNFCNKKYAKNPTKIHGIKRRPNEGLQAFMDRLKSESSHIKGVPPVIRISAFMHDHGHPELAKKINDKIPKTIDEMFEWIGAFIKGEVAAGSAEMVRPSQGDKGYVRPAWTGGPERARNRGGPRETRRNIGVYTPYPIKYTFTLLTKNLKEILAMESISFPEPPPLIKTLKKQKLNNSCDYHRDRGHNTNDCYQLKKQIEKSFFGRNISPPGGNRPSSNYGKGRKKQYGANGVHNNKMSFAVQHHNRNDQNEKPQSIRVALRECKHLEKVQGSWKEVQWRQHVEQMYRIIEQVILRSKEIIIKSKSELDLVPNVRETLRKLKRVNIKIDPDMSSFGVKEGRFLSYMVTEEGLRADPGRIQEIIISPTPRSPNQIRSLFLQLTTISKFIPKLAELKHSLREVRTRMETKKGHGWTNEAKEAFRKIKRKLGKLLTLAILKNEKI
nr:reverse transcriptase domain-containing protein [Tanacetum cinerariifolium]